MRKKIYLILILILLTTNCTTRLNVKRVPQDGKKPVKGVVYFLPQVEYQITIHRELKECKLEENGYRIEVAILPEITPRISADNSKAYYIDYEDLEKASKKIDFSLEIYNNGTLKNINTNVIDQTETLISNTLPGILQIASAFIGIPTGSLTSMYVKEPEKPKICKKNIEDALKDKNTNKALLTDKQTYIIRPSFKDLNWILTSESAKNKWFTPAALKNISIKNEIEKAVRIYCDIYLPPNHPEHFEFTEDIEGLVYRQPAQAEIILCLEKPCVSDSGNTFLYNSAVSIPQLGTLAFLPLENRMFESQLFNASFSENGALTNFTFNSESSAAKASASFKDSVEVVGKYLEAKRAAEKAKLNLEKDKIEAEKAKTTAELELEKAKKDLDDFRLQDK